MATHSSILAGKSHGQRRPAGYCPWGRKGVRHDSVTHNDKNNFPAEDSFLLGGSQGDFFSDTQTPDIDVYFY